MKWSKKYAKVETIFEKMTSLSKFYTHSDHWFHSDGEIFFIKCQDVVEWKGHLELELTITITITMTITIIITIIIMITITITII